MLTVDNGNGLCSMRQTFGCKHRQHSLKVWHYEKRGTTTITIQASMLPVTMNIRFNSQQGVPANVFQCNRWYCTSKLIYAETCQMSVKCTR